LAVEVNYGLFVVALLVREGYVNASDDHNR
jgi:hypothetical protein